MGERARALIWMVVAVAAAALVVVWTLGTQEDGRAWTCMENVYTLGTLLDMYCADNDGRYPAADRWVDSLRCHLRDSRSLKCPEDRSLARCSYGMNAALGGKRPEEVSNLTSLVLVYETRYPGHNPHGGLDDVISPPRHRGGNAYYVCTSLGAYLWPEPATASHFEVKLKGPPM